MTSPSRCHAWRSLARAFWYGVACRGQPVTWGDGWVGDEWSAPLDGADLGTMTAFLAQNLSLLHPPPPRASFLAPVVKVTGFGYDHGAAWAENFRLFKHFTDVTLGVRRLGSAAVDLCHVALGRCTFASRAKQWIQAWEPGDVCCCCWKWHDMRMASGVVLADKGILIRKLLSSQAFQTPTGSST